MKDTNLDRIIILMKMAGIAIGMQLVCYFLALLSVLNSKVSTLFWDLIKYGFISGVLLTLSLIIFGFLFKRAFNVHLIFVLITLTWIFPFFAVGYELGWKIDLLMRVLAICLMGMGYTLYITFQTLNGEDHPSVKSGRLNLLTGYWNLEKPLYEEKNRKSKELLARTIIPLGPILGTLFYRNFPSQSDEFSIIFCFAFAAFLFSGTGIHLAATIYILLAQKKHNVIIHV